MILSPPFLPLRQAGESDDDFVERAMTLGGPGDGSFPVSFELNWHGGVHLEAPSGSGAALPVRAIADGTVAYVRPATAESKDLNHALNYQGAWTDDGCVIIRHDTEIGANGETPTAVTFFSIYMHLQKVASDVQINQRIFRKTELGTAGRMYGVANRIHFEILCDDTNVERLTGRRTMAFPTTGNGRTDAVYGAMWFTLPQGTQLHATLPASTGALPPVVHTVPANGFQVRIILTRGGAFVQTFHLDQSQGPARAAWRAVDRGNVETDFEYELYATASARYPHSPSAGYELLRFGRVLGPDVLSPANAPHWRQVSYSTGVLGWVNLNAPAIQKYSDADFPNWWLIDASATADSRCRDPRVFGPLDWNHNGVVESRAEAQTALADPDVQRQLGLRICKLPSEWDIDTFDRRFAWLKTDPKIKMNDRDFARRKAHATALCFWRQANLGIATPWHFHPKSFIKHFRNCGWLSLDELAQLLPRVPITKGKLTAAQPGARNTPIPFANARRRFQPYAIALNNTFRRYNILNAARQTHFLAQTYTENILWTARREIGLGNHHPYEAFYGRGSMQLTWAGNYAIYGQFRRFATIPPSVNYAERRHRITHTSSHQWDAGGAHQVWFPRYDPEIVADGNFEVCDSGGFYWVSKHHAGHLNINRIADLGLTTAAIARVSVLVNGGGNGFADREGFASYIERYRGDGTDTTPTGSFIVRHNGTDHNIFVDFTPQRP